MVNFLARLTGWRTVIVNAVLVIVGVIRARNPSAVPDDAVVLAIVNAALDVVFSVPGAGIINILLRLVTRTPAFQATP